jgi:hypothetical protein
VAGCSADGLADRGHEGRTLTWGQRPTTEEYCVYLANEIKRLETEFGKAYIAFNNLEARILMLERAIMGIKHRLDGNEYDETKGVWWN